MELLLMVEGDPAAVSAVAECDHGGIEVGEPRPSASSVDLLDSPVGVGEVKDMLEVIALTITSAGGLVALVAQLRSWLRTSAPNRTASGAFLVVRDARTNVELLTIGTEADLSALERLAPQV